MNHYWFIQCCIRRPILALVILSFILLLIRQSSSPTILHKFIPSTRLTRRNTSDYDGHYTTSSNSAIVDDLQLRIEDLKRIKLSIRNELKLIQREKNKLLKEKTTLTGKNDKLLAQITKSKAQLKQLDLDITANRRRKFEQTCDSDRVSPIIFNPLKSVDINEQLSMLKDAQYGHLKYELNNLNSTSPHSIEELHKNQRPDIFDLSQCPLTKDFKFHLLEQPDSNHLAVLTDDTRSKVDLTLVKDILQTHRQYTQNPDDACLIVSLVGGLNATLELDLSKNNLIIDLIGASTSSRNSYNSAAIASSVFQQNSFRPYVDLVLPSIWQSPLKFDSIIGSVSPQSPIERKYLASYFGRGSGAQYASTLDESSQSPMYQLNPLEKILQTIHRNSIDDLFLFIYNCGLDSNTQCYEEKEKMIELSTFLIVLPDHQDGSDLDEHANDIFYLALSRGTIPVLVGREQAMLPFGEVLDWRRSALLVPTARLPEIHFILRSLSAPDLYQLKYHGRRVFENYLATAKQILDTTISLISLERFNYPPPPIQDVKTITYYPSQDLVLDVNCTTVACSEAQTDALSGMLSSEIFGPREKPFASQSYRRNYSLTLSSTYDLWNSPIYSPLNLYPSYPIDPLAPSEYKFLSPDHGYRPIGNGLGGSGSEFSHSLGGDHPNEQFTIVLLTYERQALLMKTLERLRGLAYLNKILVVWNGVNRAPPANMVWPDVGVPILVVKVDQNSLNNRFLPYDAIETDAILSMDDDSPIRPDEIVFAFRVWRQSRDRIVGFPGRYHAWDSSQNSWMYNSNHSCELSMVLTGGAFFHKYYSYIYTYNMPEAIRSIVNKFMNCEDIAMNFLVAHLTRKPPIKVTSRWTFHCPNCPSSLSEDDSHFRERHECLNTFASIYGYMPLLSTQHRSDSILFKTRLPHDKQKCFRFV